MLERYRGKCVCAFKCEDSVPSMPFVSYSCVHVDSNFLNGILYKSHAIFLNFCYVNKA